MKSTLQLLFLVLIPVVTFSQKYDVQIGGYLLLNKNHIQTFDETTTSTFPLFLQEGLVVEQTVRQKYTRGHTFNNKGSISIGLGRTDSISSRLSYRLGIDLYNQKYKVVSEFDFIEFTVLSSDTLLSEDDNPLITGFNDCDVIETPIEEVFIAEEDRGKSYNVYQLGLSGQLKYSLIKNKLDIGLGLNLRTPLHSNISERLITRTTREENGLTICNHEQILFEDKSGNYLRNLQLGGSLSLDYSLGNNLIISAGIINSFSDYHSYGEVTNIGQSTGLATQPSIKMREAFIRVRQML